MTDQYPMNQVVGEVVLLSASIIDPGPNDRKNFAPGPLQELADSIQKHGIAQHPLVRPKPDGRFEIVAGERRFRAMSLLLEWKEIPVIIRELTEEEASELMLVENVHREDLDPIEEANAYQSRMDRYGWSIAETARRAQVSEGVVRSRLPLLSLIPEARQLIVKGALPIGYGEKMATLNEGNQQQALNWFLKQNTKPSIKVFGEFVANLLEAQNQMGLFSMFLVSEEIDGVVNENNGRMQAILPPLASLPPLPSTSGSTGEIMDRYIKHLLDEAHVYEARVLMDFWLKILNVNGMRYSAYESELVKAYGTRLVGEFLDKPAPAS